MQSKNLEIAEKWLRWLFYAGDDKQSPNLQSCNSTGGDKEGHRGIALYQHGVFLYGVVSTGTEYWEASVPGAVPHDRWTNVGLRWAASIGLEVSVAM